MEFGNPIVGIEELIRSAIRSKGYVTGLTGWRIARDGSAEFSTILIRGTGTGDIVVVGTAGNPQVKISTLANAGLILFPTNSPVENFIARLIASRNNPGLVNEYLTLQIDGPSVDGATDKIQQQFNSQNNDGSSDTNWQLRTLNNGVLIVADKTGIVAFKDFKMDTGKSVKWPTNSGIEGQIAGVSSVRRNIGLGNENAGLTVVGPGMNGATDYVQIGLNSQNNDGSSNANFNFQTASSGAIMIGDNSGVTVPQVMQAGNHAYGATNITPVASTPTSVTVTGLSVKGSAFRGYATAVSTVVGSQVQGVAVSSVTSTSFLLWIFRTNTTVTTVNWEVWGEP